MRFPASRFLVFLPIVVLVLVLSSSTAEPEKQGFYHDWEDLPGVQAMGGDELLNPLPQGDNSMFTGSGRCAGCHGYDPIGSGSQTAEGEDVNPTDRWQGTMMANSAKDPFWKAKVTHEISVNPSHAAELQDKCTACHAPMGHFAALYDGEPHYNLEMLALDSLGRDGVSCNACHQQDPDSIGKFFSGELRFVLDTIFGPYGNDPDEVPIFTQPMTSFVGYEPMYGSHVEESEFCAGCHTLITETVDLEGNFTGGKFVEQATYHEWVNSSYADEESPFHAECQGCHFPRLDEEIVISSNYIFLPGRSPYGLHHMVGGNTFMLELMQQNIEELGLTANEQHFQDAMDRTFESLQQESAILELFDLGVAQDTAHFEVLLTNLTGHRFPSGYPARRAFIEFIVSDEFGNEIFSSGTMDENYEIIGLDEEWEPHYEHISSPDEVQIYEMVMSDTEGGVTTVLERAAWSHKDNRLAPLGFSLDHPSYDTTLVVGAALEDADWNFELGEEGSGTDRIYYDIPLDGFEGILQVQARLMYQSAPPKYMDEMFAYSTPEIEQFEEMYWETGPDAVEVNAESTEVLVVGVGEFEAPVISVYPNPLSNGPLTVEHFNTGEVQISVYDAAGMLLQSDQRNGTRTLLDLPYASGVYTIVVEGQGRRWIERVIRN